MTPAERGSAGRGPALSCAGRTLNNVLPQLVAPLCLPLTVLLGRLVLLSTSCRRHLQGHQLRLGGISFEAPHREGWEEQKHVGMGVEEAAAVAEAAAQPEAALLQQQRRRRCRPW